MAKPIFEIRDHPAGFRLVRFEIPGGVTSPAEFFAGVCEIEANLVGALPIYFSGRGPVWGYGMLLHAAHPTPAIAVFDPRIGYVVVATHTEKYTVGQILPDPEAEQGLPPTPR